MFPRDKAVSRNCGPALILSVLVSLVATGKPADNQVSKPAPVTPQSDNAAHKRPSSPNTPNAKAKKPGSLKTPATEAKAKPSPEEIKQRALSLLEDVQLGSDKINPVEYKILTEVETATVLWQVDRERALSIVKSAINAMRRLLEERKESTEVDGMRQSKEQMLWFLAIRKIAALQPTLVQELLSEGESTDKPKELMKTVWTEEARAMLSVATDTVERDPRLAARTAEQAFSLGQASYVAFLHRLAQRDNAEAERFATMMIDRLRDSSISPILFQNLLSFVSAPASSSTLKDHFYRAVLVRIRREISPDKTAEELADALRVARGVGGEAAEYSQTWQQEFDNTILAIEGLIKELSLVLPAPPGRKLIDMSSLSAASPANTQEIRDALFEAGSIRDPKARDREYQKLAASAARSADKSLAEEIMSMISDESMRLETTTLIYSPLIREAIADSAWGKAQQLTMLIKDPLARALVFVRVAQEMEKAREDKSSIIDAYALALNRLYRDDPTDRLAKAYLLIAGPLLNLDRDRGIDAIRASAQVVSRFSTTEQPLSESAIGNGASTWIRYSDPSMRAEEVLNLPDLVTSTFSRIAEKDTENALEIAQWVGHRGMYSLAQLAIIRVLLRRASSPTVGRTHASPPASNRVIQQKPAAPPTAPKRP
ncbi:MAG TPA: hypothetical protein VLM38_06475 [Blastocatellia bacterium]|nr:hypothetical protein [Blastocatellia bacterium]